MFSRIVNVSIVFGNDVVMTSFQTFDTLIILLCRTIDTLLAYQASMLVVWIKFLKGDVNTPFLQGLRSVSQAW